MSLALPSQGEGAPSAGRGGAEAIRSSASTLAALAGPLGSTDMVGPVKYALSFLSESQGNERLRVGSDGGSD